MSIETIRDTLEAIIVYDTEYKCDLATHEPDYKHPIDGACGALARRALASLSTIDPEAIRAEARAEAAERAEMALALMFDMGQITRDKAVSMMRAAILADEARDYANMEREKRIAEYAKGGEA